MTEITLLDGGMGQELVARSGDAPTPLWSTQVMIDHPGLVRQVHEDYFGAGASVATTNTYAIHRDRLVKAGIEDRFAALHTQALVRLRPPAPRMAWPHRRVDRPACRILPARPAHSTLCRGGPQVCRGGGDSAPAVDILLAETVASLAHASAILEGVGGQGRPVWLSVTVDDEDGSRLRSGELPRDLEPVLRVVAQAPSLPTVPAPEAMAAAMTVFGTFGLPYGAYANGFQQITKEFLERAARPSMRPACPARNDARPLRRFRTALG